MKVEATIPRTNADTAAAIGRVAGKIGFNLFRIAIALLCVGPFLWMIVSSFAEPEYAFNMLVSWAPKRLSFDNYERLFTISPMLTYLLNSFKITILVVIGRLFVSAMAGYAFARLEFPGKNQMFTFLMSAMMLPLLIAIIPLYVVYRDIGWLDTHWPLIVPPMLTNTFGMFWMRQFYLTVPPEIEDAAKVDGCGAWGTFWRIMLPLSAGHLAALGILTYISSWNEFFTPLIFLSSREMFTVPVGLAFFSGGQITDFPVLMAGSFIAILPILTIYILGQRKIIESMMRSGIK